MKKYQFKLKNLFLEADSIEKAGENELEKLSKDEEKKFKKLSSSEMINRINKFGIKKMKKYKNLKEKFPFYEAFRQEDIGRAVQLLASLIGKK